MNVFHKVRFIEPFKDGNILNGQLFKANEVAVLSPQDKEKIVNSGGVLEEIEMVVPNPLKNVEPVEEQAKPNERHPARPVRKNAKSS